MKHQVQQIQVNREILLKGREVFRENENELEAYIDELLGWNKKINLISRTVSRETLREHVVHSLLPLPLDLVSKHSKWIDSGSGGGLPGIPLAICRKNISWLLNDNVKKKMTAASQIINTLGLKNVGVISKSISLAEIEKGTGIVTKHAFKIPDLLRLLGSKPWKTIIMWKGVDGALEEIKKSGKGLNATIYEFNFGDEEPFYEGKGLVKIER
ncbi:MAG: RsmG family class I SAM-dependent methyltransferase [Balneolaceae bacterium]